MFVDRYLCMTRAQHTGVFVRVTFSSVDMEWFPEKQRYVLCIGATAASLALLWDYLQRRKKRCHEREVRASVHPRNFARFDALERCLPHMPNAA